MARVEGGKRERVLRTSDLRAARSNSLMTPETSSARLNRNNDR
jgi:hypothetical protein